MSEGERGGERRGREREREGERDSSETQMHSHTHIQQADMYTHILYYCVPYYYVLYTHPERDQCYNESRQSVPDASSGPGQ